MAAAQSRKDKLDAYLSNQEINRLLSTPSVSRVINGTYQMAQRTVKFSYWSVELRVSMYHRLMRPFHQKSAETSPFSTYVETSDGNGYSYDIVRWVSCSGKTFQSQHLTDAHRALIENIVLQDVKDHMWSDEKAREEHASACAAFQHTMREMGFDRLS